MVSGKIPFSIIVAALLWFFMFSPWTSGLFNFWIAMTCSAVILCSASFLFGNRLHREFHFSYKGVAAGVASALVLWGVFYVGDFLSSLVFDFARPQVDSIYGMKNGTDALLIGLLLLFVIGPSEEIFWRGLVQRGLSPRFGEWKSFAFTTFVYAIVHVWSFNFMLVMAALVCGIFWGLMYKFSRSLLAVVVSHALWDTLVFVVIPIM